MASSVSAFVQRHFLDGTTLRLRPAPLATSRTNGGRIPFTGRRCAGHIARHHEATHVGSDLVSGPISEGFRCNPAGSTIWRKPLFSRDFGGGYLWVRLVVVAFGCGWLCLGEVGGESPGRCAWMSLLDRLVLRPGLLCLACCLLRSAVLSWFAFSDVIFGLVFRSPVSLVLELYVVTSRGSPGVSGCAPGGRRASCATECRADMDACLSRG